MGSVISRVRRQVMGALALGACIATVGCSASATETGVAIGGEGAGASQTSTLANSLEAAIPNDGDLDNDDGPGDGDNDEADDGPTTTARRTTTTLRSTTLRSTTTLAPLTGWEATDDHLMRRLIGNGDTAASFAISIDGELVHTVALGVRSLAASDPVEPTDRFRVASISKTISAITMLQLVEDGLVGLDDHVGGLVASSLGIEAVPGGTADITVRQLLTHTSGFAQYENLFFGAQVDSCPEAATVGFGRGLQSAPGVGFRYSNMNYCVIGLLIEGLTGMSYEHAVYTHLLTPLGISGMRLAPTHDPGPDEVDHRSVIGRNYMEVLGGAGAWVATPADLVTIIDSLDLTKPGWKPLEESTLVAMQTSVNDPLIPDRGYGFGLILYGGGAYGHTGTVESTHSMVLDRGDGVSWALTVSGEYPSDTSQLAGIVDDALVAGGFVPWAPLLVE
jgi:D-alanyl-D-alanine carboxypeptidase